MISLRRLAPLVLLTAIPCLSLPAIEREEDYAIQDAAYETIKAITQARANGRMEIGRIAFIPFPGDAFVDASSVFRAELTRFPSNLQFFTRVEPELDLLVSEIEFGERREDIMDAATIQKFGRIPGVEALLYGTIREISSSDGEGTARFTLTLSEVETGRQLWSANITGTYAPPQPPLTHPKLTEALVSLASQVGTAVDERFGGSAARIDIYPLPLVADRIAFQEVLVQEMVNQSGDGFRVFSGVPGQEGRAFVTKIASDLLAGAVSDPAQLERIQKQVTGIYDDEREAPAYDQSGAAQPAVLYGRVREADLSGTDPRISVSLTIADLSSGEILWGKTLEQREDVLFEEQEKFIDRIKELVGENAGWVTWLIVGLVLLGVLFIGAVVLLFLFRMLTRPR
ncbi:MAG: hypothetical protein ACFE0O_07740 [Opitutales bacterium]